VYLPPNLHVSRFLSLKPRFSCKSCFFRHFEWNLNLPGKKLEDDMRIENIPNLLKNNLKVETMRPRMGNMSYLPFSLVHKRLSKFTWFYGSSSSNMFHFYMISCQFVSKMTRFYMISSYVGDQEISNLHGFMIHWSPQYIRLTWFQRSLVSKLIQSPMGSFFKSLKTDLDLHGFKDLWSRNSFRVTLLHFLKVRKLT